MRIPQSGLHIDDPAFPLLQAHISYQGVTSAAGNALGTTLVCADLANEPSYDGLVLKILDGGSAGQARTIQAHAGGTLTVGVAFTNSTGAVQQIAAGVRFVILTAMAGGGGPGPSPEEALTYYGVVDAVPGANQFTVGGLAGLGAGKFAGATNPYSVFVLRDAGGASAAPQGEAQAITAYVTGTGVFTTAAFTAAVGVGDEVLIVSPMLANILVILAGLAVPPIDSAVNLLMRDVTGNKADTALYAATLTDSLMRYLKAVLHTEVLAIGTFTTSSATVPADTGRTEANDAWKGCLLMPLVAGAGPTAFQPKRIVAFTNAGGIFTMDPGNPFTSATGLVAYAILPAQADFVPAADSVRNVSTPEAVGNKADAATTDDMSALATASLIAEAKRILLRMSTNAFTADIQGVARTELDTMLGQLATYISALGAAYSATVNPGAAAKTNIEQTLEDLGDMLAGAPGIVTFPAAAVPGNGVSMAEVLRQIYNDVVALAGAGILHEQADTPVTINAIAAGETNVLNLVVAATRYVVRSLRLKCADPGANTVTVRLYELINGASTLVDTFTITTANFGTFFSLMDLWGIPHLAGGNLRVTVQATGGGPYAVIGSYAHATAS